MLQHGYPCPASGNSRVVGHVASTRRKRRADTAFGGNGRKRPWQRPRRSRRGRCGYRYRQSDGCRLARRERPCRTERRHSVAIGAMCSLTPPGPLLTADCLLPTSSLTPAASPADQVAVEIVDRHAGVDHDSLGVDAAGTRAQQKGHHVGHLFGLHGPLAQRGLLGVQIGVDVAGNAGRGRSLQQPRRHGVEPDARKTAERLGQEGQRRIEGRLTGAM